MMSGGLPRTKLAETTSTPELSISTRTRSCDALYSATTSFMNVSASRLLKVKRMVSRPSDEHPASIAAPSTPTVVAATHRRPALIFVDTFCLLRRTANMLYQPVNLLAKSMSCRQYCIGRERGQE